MKTCKVEGCNWLIFGGGYCKRHQYLRTKAIKDEQAKVPYTRIKPRSDKMAVKMALYNHAKELAIIEARKTGPVLCFACNKEIVGFIAWHHTEGRDEYLLEFKKMVFMHSDHHSAIHDLDVEHLEQRPWYATYLANLKEFNIELYEREIAKKTKL